MDLQCLQTFIRVAQLQSFTKAAGELGSVQSTVTMQINRLEQELGYPLFDRIGKKISLTAPGHAFLASAHEIVHIWEKAGTLAPQANGVLRIGVLESLLFAKLTALLPVFKQAHPHVDLRISMGQTTDLKQQLTRNQLDIVYLSDDPNTDPDLNCLYKHPEELVFLCGAKHPLAGTSTLSASALFEHEFIVTERSGICFGRLRALAAEHGAMLKDSVEIDSTAVIASLLKTGMGLAFLPQYAVADSLADGSLVALPVDIAPQGYYSQILCHKDRWLSPTVRSFTQLIQNRRVP